MKHQTYSIRQPVWSDPRKTTIDCFIRSSAWAVELPFTASPDDTEEHGRLIFQRCLAGEFGKIGPYRALPTEPNEDILSTPPKWVENWPEVHDFLVEANAENARNSSRGIGLIWGSMLETMLKTYAHAELTRAGRGKHSLKHPDGRKCGDNFKRWIEGAKHEKMIDSILEEQLHSIRRIRNVCAHEWRLNFDNPKVRKIEGDFELLRLAYTTHFLPQDFKSMMSVFSSSCCCIIISLADRRFQDPF